MYIFKRKKDIVMTDFDCFQLDEILDCGQAFRFTKQMDGSWRGIAFCRVLQVLQQDNEVIFFNIEWDDFEAIWRPYFDLDRDYLQIAKTISQNEIISTAFRFASGIRILRQEPFETLCTFIISQNNNIPRIKGIISRLCEHFGEEIADGQFSFPSPERLASLSEESLAPLRAGFRNRYLLSAARLVATGEIDLERLHVCPLAEAREELKRICGVGNKVADCTLLFGLGRLDAFPVDVWMTRVMTQLLPDGLPDFAKPYAGIAQQYLFHYARMLGIGKK